jgi:hypothetical protein
MLRCAMIWVLCLLLSAGFFLTPVLAADTAGPDTSGSDLDIGRIATGILADDPWVVLSPPRWQWNAERYMEEGRRCAEKCRLFHDEYVNSPENSLTTGSVFQSGNAFCDCAQKNYNKAFQLTKSDDYQKQAEIFEAGTSLYDSIGMTKEARQMEDAATVARAHAAVSGFLPLSSWVTLLAIIGALLLVVVKRRR